MAGKMSQDELDQLPIGSKLWQWQERARRNGSQRLPQLLCECCAMTFKPRLTTIGATLLVSPNHKVRYGPHWTPEVRHQLRLAPRAVQLPHTIAYLARPKAQMGFPLVQRWWPPLSPLPLRLRYHRWGEAPMQELCKQRYKCTGVKTLYSFRRGT